ncbi:MAG TPA: hypothetical protein VIK53_16945 [Verrucomicrobiae bacterium]
MRAQPALGDAPPVCSHTKFAKGCSGFITAALQSDRMDVRMIDDQGKLLSTTAVPPVSA